MADCCLTKEGNWFRYRAAGLIVEEGKLLLIGSPSLPYLYTPGGAVHLGETAENCVCREILEETGLNYAPERLCAVCESLFSGQLANLKGLHCHVLEFWFIMRPRGRAEGQALGVDWNGCREELHWIPLEEIKQLDVRPAFLKERLPSLLQGGVQHLVSNTLFREES